MTVYVRLVIILKLKNLEFKHPQHNLLEFFYTASCGNNFFIILGVEGCIF